MPIEVISGRDAFASINKFSRWPHPGKDGDRYLPHPTVNHKAGFAISPEDKLFTIGSCFARNVERALVALGLPVLSSIVDGTEPGENITNKYTTSSIVHDLRVAFDGADPYATINDINENSAINLTFGGMGASKANSRADIETQTDLYYETLRRLRETDVVVLTLGLVETWFDTKFGIYINLAPPPRLAKANPDRFQLHVLSYDDIRSDVLEILSTLRRECRPGVRFLVTVSPVPLAATFRNQDVLQANAYSKAVQRAAIETIVLENDDVTYFPSFEMVTLSAPEHAWVDDDYRHVRPDTVDRIMRFVVSQYVSPDSLAPSKAVLFEMTKAKRWSDVVQTVEAYCGKMGKQAQAQPPHVQWYYAKALAETGKIADAVPLLRNVVAALSWHESAKALLAKLGG